MLECLSLILGLKLTSCLEDVSLCEVAQHLATWAHMGTKWTPKPAPNEAQNGKCQEHSLIQGRSNLPSTLSTSNMGSPAAPIRSNMGSRMKKERNPWEPMGTQTFPNGYAAILLASSAAGGHRGATKYLPLWDVLVP